MKLKQLNKSKGFTIIETLIVLAIAATIFLVVFLAVTALNRSSRNTQRKDDAGAVIAGVGEYASNNSGALPTQAYYAAPNLILCVNTDAATCTGGTDATTNVKLGYYAQVTKGVATAGEVYLGTAIPTGAANDSLNIITGATCNGNVATTTGASSRGVAAQYGIESAGGFTWQCQAS